MKTLSSLVLFLVIISCNNIEFTYALHEETESNKFVVKSQMIIPLERPNTTKGYVPFAETMDFEKTVYKWGMDKIKEHENDVKLEETKMKRMLNDMMSRQDLEKGATISEDTVWGYGLFGTSGKTSPVAPEDPQSLHTD